jgi:hypothetical protein
MEPQGRGAGGVLGRAPLTNTRELVCLRYIGVQSPLGQQTSVVLLDRVPAFTCHALQARAVTHYDLTATDFDHPRLLQWPYTPDDRDAVCTDNLCRAVPRKSGYIPHRSGRVSTGASGRFADSRCDTHCMLRSALSGRTDNLHSGRKDQLCASNLPWLGADHDERALASAPPSRSVRGQRQVYIRRSRCRQRRLPDQSIQRAHSDRLPVPRLVRSLCRSRESTRFLGLPRPQR